MREIDQDLQTLADDLRGSSRRCMLTTKPTPQASCSLAGSYRPCAAGRPYVVVHRASACIRIAAPCRYDAECACSSDCDHRDRALHACDLRHALPPAAALRGMPQFRASCADYFLGIGRLLRPLPDAVGLLSVRALARPVVRAGLLLQQLDESPGGAAQLLAAAMNDAQRPDQLVGRQRHRRRACRRPLRASTVGSGNRPTPASISMARLIVSMLSNSITTLDFDAVQGQHAVDLVANRQVVVEADHPSRRPARPSAIARGRPGDASAHRPAPSARRASRSRSSVRLDLRIAHQSQVGLVVLDGVVDAVRMQILQPHVGLGIAGS